MLTFFKNLYFKIMFFHMCNKIEIQIFVTIFVELIEKKFVSHLIDVDDILL